MLKVTGLKDEAYMMYSYIHSISLGRLRSKAHECKCKYIHMLYNINECMQLYLYGLIHRYNSKFTYSHTYTHTHTGLHRHACEWQRLMANTTKDKCLSSILLQFYNCVLRAAGDHCVCRAATALPPTSKGWGPYAATAAALCGNLVCRWQFML